MKPPSVLARYRAWRGAPLRLRAELVWLLDEALDRVPARSDGRWRWRGQWGCTLGLHRYWARNENQRGSGHQ